MPSPDWNGVLLRWKGRLLDGSPAAGRLVITSDAARFLDDDEVQSESIISVPLVVPIVNGYAEIEVPATDDPDIIPNGFTYTIVEELTKGQGRTLVTDAPLAKAVDGIDLNRLIDIDPSPGTPLPPITRAELDALAYKFVRLDQQAIALDEDGTPYWADGADIGEDALPVRIDADGKPYVYVPDEGAPSIAWRDAPFGLAPLDGDGRLPEANVPERLTPAGVQAALVEYASDAVAEALADDPTMADAAALAVSEELESAGVVYYDDAPVLGINYAKNARFTQDLPFTVANGWTTPSATGTWLPGGGLRISAGSAAASRLEGYVDLPPGTYTASVYYTVNQIMAPAPSSTFGQITRVDTGANLGAGLSIATTTTATIGLRQRASTTFTVPPDNTGQTRIRYYVGGSTVTFEKVQVEPGTAPTDFLYGDAPGCDFADTPHLSPSIKRLPSKTETLAGAPELARNSAYAPWAVGGSITTVSVAWSREPNGRAYRLTAESAWTTDTTPRLTYGDAVRSFREIPVTPGEVWSLATRAAFSKAGVLWAGVFFWDSSGAALAYRPVTAKTAVVANTPVDFVLEGLVVPATAVRMMLQVRVDSAAVATAVGDHLTCAETVITKSPRAGIWYDGDSPGAKWAGTPGESPALKIVGNPIDEARLVWLESRLVEGSGRPEGVVAAPVGTRYTDRATTNGVIEWIKASGTGTTGWRVATGDTGRRNIAATVTWPFTLVNSALLRRVNERVYLDILAANPAALAGGSTGVATGAIPTGFRPIPAASSFKMDRSVGDEPITVTVQATGNITFQKAATGGSLTALSASWITDDAWPTTLPGTAI